MAVAATANTALAQHSHTHKPTPRHRSLANNRVEWPSRDAVVRTLLLRDYNTRVVLFGTTLLGVSAGLVGVFMLLRRRSLVGDVISHASLPGIAVAFITMEVVSAGSGKWLPGLLIGALISGVLGVVCVKLILQLTRIKEDATLALVLSIFFGLGIALFTVIQEIPTGNAAGLNHFIYGKAASLVAADVWLIVVASLIVVGLFTLFFKEFAVLSFDEKFAASEGWPVFRLDLVLMALVTAVTVIGLQSVGLLLVVALLIIPPAAARFWSDNLTRMTLASATIGGLSAAIGVFLSAIFPRLAAGAVIVLTGTALFVISMFCGYRRGVFIRLYAHWRLKHSVGRHHLLRAMFECIEPRCSSGELQDELTAHLVSRSDLLPMRSWTESRLAGLLGDAQRAELIVKVRDDGYRLTRQGAEESHRVVRNHRLWELYLIEYADIAASHVDRDADDIEHLLGPDVVSGLEQLLSERFPHLTVPPSPHDIVPTTES